MFFASTAIWLHFSTVVYKAEQSVLGHTLAISWPWYLIKVREGGSTTVRSTWVLFCACVHTCVRTCLLQC
jgi:hypothetical protein